MIYKSEKTKEASELIKKAWLDESDSFPWIIGYSAGKDSTLLTHLVIDMLKNIHPDLRTRRGLAIICNDTRVESPIYQEYVDNQLRRMRIGMSGRLPMVEVIDTKAPETDSFWFNLMGKGYPAPHRSFRWCTSRLKIRTTATHIKEKIKEHGGAILLLGVRKAESQQRAKTIAKHERESFHTAQPRWLTPHTEIKDCHVFTPIKDLSNAELWGELLPMRDAFSLAWGADTKEMVELYRDANLGDCDNLSDAELQALVASGDKECPFVNSLDDQASCGSKSARFGCWTCTVVKKDKSLESLAKTEGKEWLGMLAGFRNRLREVSDTPQYRSKTRRSGQYGLGPLTMEARKMLLEELLELQRAVGRELITEGEITLINRQWSQDKDTAFDRYLEPYFKAGILER